MDYKLKTIRRFLLAQNMPLPDLYGNIRSRDYEMRLARITKDDDEDSCNPRHLFDFACLVASADYIDDLLPLIDRTTFYDGVHLCQRFSVTHKPMLELLLRHWRMFTDKWPFDLSMEVALCLEEVDVFDIYKRYAPPVTHIDDALEYYYEVNPFALAAIYDIDIPDGMIERMFGGTASVRFMMFYDMYCSLNARSWRAFGCMWRFFLRNLAEFRSCYYNIPTYRIVVWKGSRMMYSVRVIQRTWRKYRRRKRMTLAMWTCKQLGLPVDVGCMIARLEYE